MPFSRCALIVAHPGHELRIFGWVCAKKPLVFILTDGSGHGEASRLHLTTEILQSIGALPSTLFGIASDHEIYNHILEQNYSFFINLSKLIAQELIEKQIECVAGDALEGYNPTHDLCRIVINLAIHFASKQIGYTIKNYMFPLVAHPSPKNFPSDSLYITLSEKEFIHKIEVSRSYAKNVKGMLVSEIDQAIIQYGKDAFRNEILFTDNTSACLAQCNIEKPFYESYGEKQVAAGHYKQVIRYHEHIAPIIRAIVKTQEQFYVNECYEAITPIIQTNET